MLAIVVRRTKYGQMILLVALLLLLSMQSAMLSRMLLERIMLCLEILIPSLFGGMAVCHLMMHMGALDALDRGCTRLCKGKMGMGRVWGVYVLSQLAGYPMGAALLRNLEQTGQLSGEQAKRLSYGCFGAGPSFLIGLAGAQLLGSVKAGWLLFLCCSLANLPAAFYAMRGISSMPSAQITETHVPMAQALVKSAQLAMEGLMRICAVVLLFGLIFFLAETVGLIALLCRLGERLGIRSEVMYAFLSALLDITQLGEVCIAGLPYPVLLPLMAALLSFGGLCVHCQCVSLGTEGLSFPRLLGIRALCALLSAFFCLLFLPFFPAAAVMDVFAPQASVSQSGSLLPGLLILCTGFPIILKKDWTN